MPDEILEGEVVENAPMDSVALALAVGLTLSAKDKAQMQIIDRMTTLNWRDLKPPEMALLLMQKPFQAQGGGVYYLTPMQALVFAQQAYTMGLNPLQNSQIFFNVKTWTAAATYEGKRLQATDRDLDIGPPAFIRQERPWKDVTRLPGLKFDKDIAYTAKVRVGTKGDVAEYTAWLSEWYMPSSPVWKERTEHMLQTRAAEKAQTMAMGSGASAMPDETEIAPQV